MAIENESRLELPPSDQETSSTPSAFDESELESESSELSTPTDSNSLEPSSDSDLDSWSLLFSTDESAQGDARDDETPWDDQEDATGHSVNTLQGSMSLTLPKIDLHQTPAPVVKNPPPETVLSAFWNLKLLRLVVVFSFLAALSILGVSQTLSNPNYVKIYPHFMEKDMADLTEAFRSPGSVSFDEGKNNWIALFATDDALVRATIPAELVDMDPGASIGVKDFLQSVESKLNLVCSDVKCYSVVKHHEDRGVMDLKLVIKPDSLRLQNHDHMKQIINKFKCEPRSSHGTDLITVNPSNAVSVYTEARELTEAVLQWIKEQLELAALAAYEVAVGVQTHARAFIEKGQAKLTSEEPLYENFHKVALSKAEGCLTKTKDAYHCAKRFSLSASKWLKGSCAHAKKLIESSKPVSSTKTAKSMRSSVKSVMTTHLSNLKYCFKSSGDKFGNGFYKANAFVKRCQFKPAEQLSGLKTGKIISFSLSKWFHSNQKLNRGLIAIKKPWKKVSASSLHRFSKNKSVATNKARCSWRYALGNKNHPCSNSKDIWQQAKCRWSTGRTCPKSSQGYLERATKFVNKFVY